MAQTNLFIHVPIKGEIWKKVVGYEGLYSVSNFGRVYNRKTRYFLKANSNRDGYLFVGIKKDGVYKTVRIHRLVAFAFIPLVEGKDCVNHRNGIKSDNRVKNLEWCTPKENYDHAVANRLIKRLLK